MQEKSKQPGVFGAQFKILENGSIINYSPHTAWMREDGKQPRVIRHDGLAFVPDPRVYGKCRPAALKDFVAYKFLPRAKLRVLAKSPKLDRAKQTSKQGVQDTTKSQTSPKKPPPKNLEQLLSQSRNRRALGHDGLFKRIHNKTRATSANPDTAVMPKPTGKQNPLSKLKKSRLDNADIEFECDTSISLSDTELTRKTPSPKKPAPKKLDTKKTPEDFDQQCRRSMRNRTNALAGKLGNAIPISLIEAQDRDIRSVVFQVEAHKTNRRTKQTYPYKQRTKSNRRHTASKPTRVDLLIINYRMCGNPIGIRHTEKYSGTQRTKGRRSHVSNRNGKVRD